SSTEIESGFVVTTTRHEEQLPCPHPILPCSVFPASLSSRASSTPTFRPRLIQLVTHPRRSGAKSTTSGRGSIAQTTPRPLVSLWHGCRRFTAARSGRPTNLDLSELYSRYSCRHYSFGSDIRYTRPRTTPGSKRRSV